MRSGFGRIHFSFGRIHLSFFRIIVKHFENENTMEKVNANRIINLCSSHGRKGRMKRLLSQTFYLFHQQRRGELLSQGWRSSPLPAPEAKNVTRRLSLVFFEQFLSERRKGLKQSGKKRRSVNGKIRKSFIHTSPCGVINKKDSEEFTSHSDEFTFHSEEFTYHLSQRKSFIPSELSLVRETRNLSKFTLHLKEKEKRGGPLFSRDVSGGGVVPDRSPFLPLSFSFFHIFPARKECWWFSSFSSPAYSSNSFKPGLKMLVHCSGYGTAPVTSLMLQLSHIENVTPLYWRFTLEKSAKLSHLRCEVWGERGEGRGSYIEDVTAPAFLGCIRMLGERDSSPSPGTSGSDAAPLQRHTSSQAPDYLCEAGYREDVTAQTLSATGFPKPGWFSGIPERPSFTLPVTSKMSQSLPTQPLLLKGELKNSPSLPLAGRMVTAGKIKKGEEGFPPLREGVLSWKQPARKKVEKLLLEKFPFSIKQSVDNSTPTLEVRKKRIARNIRLIPSVVRKKRGVRLALRPLIGEARKKGKSFSQSFSQELLESFHGKGVGRETRDAVHKSAEGNRSFLRFRWW